MVSDLAYKGIIGISFFYYQCFYGEVDAFSFGGASF